MTLKQAIGIIMGANIGTTVTAWITTLAFVDSGDNWFLWLFDTDTLAPIALAIGIILIMFIKSKKSKPIGDICIGFGATLMGLTGVIMFVACPLVFRVLTPDPQVRELATQVLRIGLIAEPLFGAAIVGAGALRGTGDTFVPSMICMGSIWIVRLGMALLLVGRFGLHGMWIAMATELCIRGLLMLHRQKTTKYYDRYIQTAK